MRSGLSRTEALDYTLGKRRKRGEKGGKWREKVENEEFETKRMNDNRNSKNNLNIKNNLRVTSASSTALIKNEGWNERTNNMCTYIKKSCYDDFLVRRLNIQLHAHKKVHCGKNIRKYFTDLHTGFEVK